MRENSQKIIADLTHIFMFCPYYRQVAYQTTITSIVCHFLTANFSPIVNSYEYLYQRKTNNNNKYNFNENIIFKNLLYVLTYLIKIKLVFN